MEWKNLEIRDCVFSLIPLNTGAKHESSLYTKDSKNDFQRQSEDRT